MRYRKGETRTGENQDENEKERRKWEVWKNGEDGEKRKEEGMAGTKEVDRVRSDSLQGFCAFVVGDRVVGWPQGRYANRQRYCRQIG